MRLEGVYRFGGGARRHRRRRGGDGRPVRVARGVRRPPRSARGKRYDLWCLVGCSTAALLRNCGPLDAVGQGCARRRDVLAQYRGPRRYLTPPGALFRWLVPQRGVAGIEGALVHRSRAAARRCHLRGGSLPPARGRGATWPSPCCAAWRSPPAPPGAAPSRPAPPRRSRPWARGRAPSSRSPSAVVPNPAPDFSRRLRIPPAGVKSQPGIAVPWQKDGHCGAASARPQSASAAIQPQLEARPRTIHAR